MNKSNDTIAVTGATGYVGGRLAPKLLESGYKVRCLVRNSRKLKGRSWSDHPNLESTETDLLDVDTLAERLTGCTVAYYLVHSMITAGEDYDRVDQKLARNFAEAAEKAGVKQIIYLGGLGELGDNLSDHLTSRRHVEDSLSHTSVPVTVLRAAMIIGSGSASFEILRYLVERLPIMVTPRWVSTKCQPISIVDVLNYLQECLSTPESIGKDIDIGGSEVLTYRDLMKIVAEELNLPREDRGPVPVLLTPRLSSY